MILAEPNAVFSGSHDSAGRRLAFALAASLALHALTLALNSKLAHDRSGMGSVTTLSVTLTDLKTNPQLAQSERMAPGEGGGVTDRPGHTESASVVQERYLDILSTRSEMQIRLEKSEESGLPTKRKVVVHHGERALLQASRQARSEANAGFAERGGYDCIVSGFYFCGSPGSELAR